MRYGWGIVWAALAQFALAQDDTRLLTPEELREHANCLFFKPGPRGKGAVKPGQLTQATATVVERLAAPAAFKSPPREAVDNNLIDRHLFTAMKDAGVTPAPIINDYEFIRRVTLDLTGRLPALARVDAFVADRAGDKRSKLVDELLASPEWVDKWTMFYGDLFKVNSQNTQVRRFNDGVGAWYKFLSASLQANKPYDQLARELIAATGTDNYTQGPMNYLVGSVVAGQVPQHDTYDKMAVDVATAFLGLSHLDCLLCHDGRRHLDELSLWGKSTTRLDAWKFAAFFSHTAAIRRPVEGARNGFPYQYSLLSDPQPPTVRRALTDYPLATTTGNRPARQPVGTITAVAPEYVFSGKAPGRGEEYRTVLAREITADTQFARAAVNYVWEHFFTVGIVNPSDAFDPARLDPDNPPPVGWSLQPSNARLLNDLATDFQTNKFNLKALMKLICTSDAYQLSSRYPGAWDPAWEPLFARKFVRRLWAEEVHDAIATSSGILTAYTLERYGLPATLFAMKLPETFGAPAVSRSASRFLDTFLRGNRDDEERQGDMSVAQVLALMNDPFVTGRIRATNPQQPNSLLVQAVRLTDADLVKRLYLTVLSRPPSEAENTAALNSLRAPANRNQAAEDLLWTLYNKADFVYNY